MALVQQTTAFASAVGQQGYRPLRIYAVTSVLFCFLSCLIFPSAQSGAQQTLDNAITGQLRDTCVALKGSLGNAALPQFDPQLRAICSPPGSTGGGGASGGGNAATSQTKLIGAQRLSILRAKKAEEQNASFAASADSAMKYANKDFPNGVSVFVVGDF